MQFRSLFDKHSLAGYKVSQSNNKFVTFNIHVLTGYFSSSIEVIKQLSRTSQRSQHFYNSDQAACRFYDAIKHVEFVVGPAARFYIDTGNFACLSIEFRPALESNYVPMCAHSFILLTHLFIARDTRAPCLSLSLSLLLTFSLSAEDEKLFSINTFARRIHFNQAIAIAEIEEVR